MSNIIRSRVVSLPLAARTRLLSTTVARRTADNTGEKIKSRVAEDAHATEDQASVADHSKGTGNHSTGAGPQDPVGKSFTPEVKSGQVSGLGGNKPAGGTTATEQRR